MEGEALDAAWWSISAYRASGRLIPDKAGRHAFSSRDIVRRGDGSFRVVLSPRPLPGNWLPTGESGEFQVMLRIFGPRASQSPSGERRVDTQLPRIERLACL